MKNKVKRMGVKLANSLQPNSQSNILKVINAQRETAAKPLSVVRQFLDNFIVGLS